MSNKPLKISEEAKVQMPMKTVASLIALVAIGTWAYFGINEQLNKHSTQLEFEVRMIDEKLEEMFEMDEEIMKQHEDLFKKLDQGNTGYSYN